MAAPWVLCSDFGPSLEEEHWGDRTCPEKGNEGGERAGAQVLQATSEGAGLVSSGASRETLEFSPAPWKEGVTRWELASSPR